VSVWQEKFGVIEWGSLILYAGVGEVLKEFDDGRDGFRVTLQFRDSIDIGINVIDIWVQEVSSASIELHDFFE
jgi:hypothetical protein